jgi:hypothetical protein
VASLACRIDVYTLRRIGGNRAVEKESLKFCRFPCIPPGGVKLVYVHLIGCLLHAKECLSSVQHWAPQPSPTSPTQPSTIRQRTSAATKVHGYVSRGKVAHTQDQFAPARERSAKLPPPILRLSRLAGHTRVCVAARHASCKQSFIPHVAC